MKNDVTEVHRKNDHIMRVWISMEGTIINIFSVYVPKVGCTEEEQTRFWTKLNEESGRSRTLLSNRRL